MRYPAAMRRIADALLLAAVVLFGAVLRFGGISVPSLWLDEILDYDVATKLAAEPLWRWLTGFASEHGPLFFATELAGRLAHSPELAARIAPAIFGVAAIIVAAIGCRLSDRWESTIFALLLAGSPLAIYYSREARPYALLMLLATSMLAAMLRATRSEEPPSPFLLLIPFIALFATSGAAPLLVASALTAGIAFLIERRRFLAIYALASLFAAAFIPLLYRRMPGSAAGAGFRPIGTRFFQRLLQSFSTGAIGNTPIHRVVYIVALLALAGAVALIVRDRLRGTIVTGMAILPVAVTLAALWRLGHWFAVRYVATALPAYLFLVAIGIVTLLRLLLRGPTAAAIPVVALVAAGFIIREGWPAATTEPYRKLNWRVIAATIHEHAHARDAVLTTNDWSYVCLHFYLKRLPPRVRLISAGESSSRAASIVAHNEPVWIVSAGFHRPGDIGDWSCQYPVVLASPLEGFRLHYAPGLRHLMLNRFTAADVRALTARYPTHVFHLGSANDAFLAGDWYNSEGSTGDVSRWTGPEPASVMLIGSAKTAHRLMLRMLPFSYRGSPPQIATISLNAAPLARLTLAPDWHEYYFDIPRATWREGMNFLTISFSHAAAPSSIDSASPDHRLLAARFNQIALVPLGTTVRDDSLSELARAFRINEPGEFLDENAWWRGRSEKTLAPPEMLARIGADPSRHAGVEEIAETVAYDSDCLNDSDFLHIAYAEILGRPIDPGGERYFASALNKKETRLGVVKALVDSPEFRKNVRPRR
jgi:hypothetical protein